MIFLATLMTLVAAGDLPLADRPLLDEASRRRALLLALPDRVPPDSSNEVADDPRAIILGEKLFTDPGLSGDGTMSCSTCHPLATLFTDGEIRPRGPAKLRRDTPTLWNIGWQRWFGWDGRSDSLWMQALEPIEAPGEMNGDRILVLRHIAGDDALRRLFEEIFGALPSLDSLPERSRVAGVATDGWGALSGERRLAIDGAYASVGKSIAAWERTLIRAGSPFDRYLEALEGGDEEAALRYPAAARRGLLLFLGRAGCSTCHSGPVLSDGEFHDTGVPGVGGQRPKDPGRYAGVDFLKGSSFSADGAHSATADGSRGRRTSALRRRGEQWGAFRTPSLRFVGDTGPYFHHGALEDLEAVVRFYNRREGAFRSGHHDEATLQPLGLDEEEEAQLVHFLKTLSGPIGPP